jgi:enamine deaminase RidA (YjgF/YER057c/UK114 family)
MQKKSYPFFYGRVKQTWPKAVVAGDFVFVSGVSGREFETGKVKALDVKVQTEVAWAKIKSILEEVGSSLNGIVKVVTYLRDAKEADVYYAASAKFLEKECPDLLENPPAMTMAETGLYLEEMLVELDVTAIMPE